jgi:uncharacterized membrane protein
MVPAKDAANTCEFAEKHRSAPRIAPIDFVRGIAMILMAIDHVRVYSGLPAGGSTPGIFFTRWVTHFSAPIFVFLAGTGAYLHAHRHRNPGTLSTFLLSRGIWLVFLELTVLRLAWTFNFDYRHYVLAGVIWMIGWCMIALAPLVRLPVPVIAIIGTAIILLHNLTDLFRQGLGQAFGENGPNWILKLLYFGGIVQLGPDGPPLFILYVLIPWIGVMMAGYAFGAVMTMSPARRRSVCLRLGISITLAFIALRAVNLYGDPRPWRKANPGFANARPRIDSDNASRDAAIRSPRVGTSLTMPPILSFLNTTKYPASLSFLLMTLGPMFLLLAIAEQLPGTVLSLVTTYGRVPLFYYLLHIPLIHLAACIASIARQGHISSWLFADHPSNAGPPPAGYPWTIGFLPYRAKWRRAAAENPRFGSYEIR